MVGVDTCNKPEDEYRALRHRWGEHGERIKAQLYRSTGRQYIAVSTICLFKAGVFSSGGGGGGGEGDGMTVYCL